MMNLREATHRLEDAIITLSGPALAISGILAGVDLLTGGHFMQHMAWLTLAWAITLMLTLDFQVLTLGVRAKRIYLSDKATRRKAAEIALACLIAAGIAFVSVQMQSIIARSNGIGISVEQATVQLGVNPLWLVWERSALVLFLIFLAGWFREGEPVKQAVSHDTPSSISDETMTVILAKLQKLDTLEQALAQHSITVSEVKEQLLALPEQAGVSGETESDAASLQAQIGALLLETPDLSSRDVAERLQRPHSTVYRHMKRLEQQKQSA